MVFGDALKRVADEADVALLEIVEPAEIIEDFAGRRVGVQGVDREVAAGGVRLPVVGERHRRAAAVGRDVAPKVVISNGWPSLTAVIVPCSMPGRHRLDARLLQPRE